MSARAASPRILVLAGVAALHALALLLLVTGTRARLVPPGMTDVAPLIVALLEPHERPRTAASGHVPRALSPRIAPTAPLPSEAPPVPPRPDAGTAIDWAAQASALAPPKSALFAAQAKRHGFQWDYARAHRVEGIPGLATVVHLGDRCAV